MYCGDNNFSTIMFYQISEQKTFNQTRFKKKKVYTVSFIKICLSAPILHQRSPLRP